MKTYNCPITNTTLDLGQNLLGKAIKEAQQQIINEL
jgi:hypothetical protein